MTEKSFWMQAYKNANKVLREPAKLAAARSITFADEALEYRREVSKGLTSEAFRFWEDMFLSGTVSEIDEQGDTTVNAKSTHQRAFIGAAAFEQKF